MALARLDSKRPRCLKCGKPDIIWFVGDPCEHQKATPLVAASKKSILAGFERCVTAKNPWLRLIRGR